MQISIDQMTTIVSTAPLKFLLEKQRQKSDLYFHIVLQMSGEKISGEKRARFKKYIAGFMRATGGTLLAIAAANNRLYILVGLQQTRAPANFVSELKLVSKTFLRRRLGVKNFVWREEYEAFTVSLSQIEHIKSYIRRQTRLEKREDNFSHSWQSIGSGKVF